MQNELDESIITSLRENDGLGIVDDRLLRALDGFDDDNGLVHRGAFLWGPNVDAERTEGVFNHILVVSAVAYHLAKQLTENDVDGFQEIDVATAVQAALLHDIGKFYGESREKLSPDEKAAHGIPPNFNEAFSPEIDQESKVWLERAGYGEDVINAIMDQDFPQKPSDDPYYNIVLVSNYMVGQHIMPTEERVDDVRTRWIKQKIEAGESPRMDPYLFENAASIIQSTASALFASINMTQEDFIEMVEANKDEDGYYTPWEAFLRETRAKRQEEKAIFAVRTILPQ